MGEREGERERAYLLSDGLNLFVQCVRQLVMVDPDLELGEGGGAVFYVCKPVGFSSFYVYLFITQNK